MHPVYYVEAGDTLPVMFTTYDGGTGASITLTGLAVTDIEIYKDGSVTQRSSDAGYALIDTDGIDIDTTTGLHGFTLDLSDNTDAGFYAVGSWYHVVVNAVTVDTQTVVFIACAFRIVSATRGLAGTALPDAAADAAGGLPISDAGGLDVDTLNSNVSAILTDTGTTLQAELDGIQADTEDIQSTLGTPAGADIAADIAAVKAETASILTDTGTTLDNLVDDLESRLGTPSDFGSGTSTIAANLQDLADNGTAAFDRSTDSLQALRDHIADGTNLTEAGGDGDHLTEAGGTGDHLTALATASALTTVDTVVDAIKAKTDNLPTGIAKNVALSGFPFLMVDATDFATPETGLTITGEISQDGGAFAALTNAEVEVGDGIYTIDLTQAEMNADTIVLKFTASGAAQRTIVLVTDA